MRVRPNLRDQPTEYLEFLIRELREELAFRRSIQPKNKVRCSSCGHTGHNVMTCGERDFPKRRHGEKCDCGRTDCPDPVEVSDAP